MRWAGLGWCASVTRRGGGPCSCRGAERRRRSAGPLLHAAQILAPYTLPCLFALVLLPNLHRAERALLRTLVPVSALFAAFGLYAASYRLVEVLANK